MGPKSTWEEIWVVYNEVYQLKRAPSMNLCNVDMMENIHQEILNSIKECLWHRWECAQPEEDPGQRSASASRLDHQYEFQQRVHATCNHFRDLKEGSCEQTLAVAWDTHSWVLVAVVLLEDKIEKLSHSISHGHWRLRSHRQLRSQRQSCSHWQRRSRAADQSSRGSPAPSCHGEHISRRAQSPSLSHSRQWVTFEDSPSIGADDSWLLSWADEMAWGDHTDWSQPEAEDLGCPPTLHLCVQDYLSREEAPWAADKCEDDSDSSNAHTLPWRYQQVGSLVDPPGRNTGIVARAAGSP